ncbi:hypothetical protein KXV68_002604, partial [Aspergillus fumigatus]
MEQAQPHESASSINSTKPFSQPIPVFRFFHHLLLDKFLGSYAPVWTDNSIKHSLGAMFLTKSALDMLVEDPKQSLRAMCSLK